MYNGWLHSVFVTGTICFAADGCIVWVKHNCPGSWNDSDTSLGFRNKLLDPVYCPDPRKNVVSDSAFPHGRPHPYAAQGRRPRAPAPVAEELGADHPQRHHRCAEWGMGCVQKVYSRLNLPLPYEPALRGLRLNNLFRLANYRVRTVGISQIRTTFAGEMELPTHLYCYFGLCNALQYM
ncbi:hypothetical protein PHYSODRAFT_286300 [Phytophthora sojae]|uniref:DDE Tnp4 domain-containing protein n=1 Tax=Phytophthora sojae (strain P6497) TaxID=1094619 RepID=G4ZMJ9_PHYSP|nr:hypothetical protein PHYSODRAFT_286300 [Phytophthora sojae]EGZ15346.1 hypothetical protein PHYSODRAFT_286300 [Phytophthora sojae]|eukprot:XP_009529095.1 hypothetical protein PHYSODRAFT_286300 [Phytophthora sojae]